jgi:hypothetical protein
MAPPNDSSFDQITALKASIAKLGREKAEVEAKNVELKAGLDKATAAIADIEAKLAALKERPDPLLVLLPYIEKAAPFVCGFIARTMDLEEKAQALNGAMARDNHAIAVMTNHFIVALAAKAGGIDLASLPKPGGDESSTTTNVAGSNSVLATDPVVRELSAMTNMFAEQFKLDAERAKAFDASRAATIAALKPAPS